MYAFIKHIKTSMEQLPAPTQVMGYNSFEEMKLSGHYNKLLDQFKEKVADPTLDTVFKLRKMLNKLSRDKQISRVSELEKRDYGIRSIQKNSRKLDKLVRSMNTYIDSAVNDDDYNNAIGVDIKLKCSYKCQKYWSKSVKNQFIFVTRSWMMFCVVLVWIWGRFWS